jgi:hypothetical protein
MLHVGAVLSTTTLLLPFFIVCVSTVFVFPALSDAFPAATVISNAPFHETHHKVTVYF